MSLTLNVSAAEVRAGDNGTHDNAHKLGADVKAYVSAPFHWDGRRWLQFGETLIAVGAAYQFDDDVRDHFVTPNSIPGDSDTHDLEDALPAAAALGSTWLYAALNDDDDARNETKDMLEAALLGSSASLVLKLAAGRERPNETLDHDRWNEGGNAFPSMHATAAFAIGTVLAESGSDDHRWIRRTLGYGLAAGTAYQRLNHNAHWLSDAVAGSALGIATAHFVLNRRDLADDAPRVSVVPLDGGLMLTYSANLTR